MKKSKLLTTVGLLSLLLLFTLIIFKTDAKAATPREGTLDVSLDYSKENEEEGWSWDHIDKTLTLTDVDITGSFYESDGQPREPGICLPEDDITIIVNGTCKITSGIMNVQFVEDYQGGYQANSNLAIQGNGKLYVDEIVGFNNVKIKDISLYCKEGFRFTPDHLTLDNTYVYANYKNGWDFKVTGKDSNLTLKNCYVKEGGAVLKFTDKMYNGNFNSTFIGSYYNKVPTKVVISRGKAPKVKKPAISKLVKNFTKVTLFWTVPQYSGGKFQIYRSTKKSSGYKYVATTYRPVYQDVKRAFHKKYYYKIKAFSNGNKTYKWSDPKAVTTGLAKVKTFGCSPDYYDSGKDYLAWTIVYGAQGYKIYRAASKNGKYKCIKTLKGWKTHNYYRKRPKSGKKYYYKIRAYRKKGKKTYYSPYKYVTRYKYENQLSDAVSGFNYAIYPINNYSDL